MNRHGWEVGKKLADVKAGDHVLLQRSFEGNIGSPGVFPEHALYFIGVMIADGFMGANSTRVSNNDPTVMQSIMVHGEEFFGLQPRTYLREGNSIAYHFNSKEKMSEMHLRLGWNPCVASGKKLGRYVRGLDRDGMASVLRGYFDCECSITEEGTIEVSSASWSLLNEVKLALAVHFGVIANLKPFFVKEYPDNDYWRLFLYGAAAETYAREVGFISEIRQAQAKGCLGKTRNPNLDVVPHLGHFLTAIHEGSAYTTCEHVTLVRDYKGDDPRAEVTYQRLGLILSAAWKEGPALDRLHEIRASNYYYDEVVSVEPLDKEPTFDFLMPETHSLVVNGIVTRNSSDRIAAATAA